MLMNYVAISSNRCPLQQECRSSIALVAIICNFNRALCNNGIFLFTAIKVTRNYDGNYTHYLHRGARQRTRNFLQWPEFRHALDIASIYCWVKQGKFRDDEALVQGSKPEPWKHVRFEVFTAVTMKNVVFWDINPQFVLHRRHITSPLQSPAS
jgi:hypothetical protein